MDLLRTSRHRLRLMSSRFHRFPTTDHSSMLDQAIDIHKRSVSNEFEDWNTSARTVKFSEEDKEDDTPRRPERRVHYKNDKHVKVEFVDTLSKQNAREHNTHKYDRVYSGGLVIRRGQPFDVVLRFNKKFDQHDNTIRFVFTTSENPRPGNGTHVDFLLSKELKRNDWSAAIAERQSKTDYVVTISTPANCIVSNWQLVVETISADERQPVTSVYVHPTLTYILFNPWCREDDVYFDNTSLLKEYVLNDSGVIFHGNHKQIGAKPWFFGQFEDGILDICMWCVQKGFNNNVAKSMSDPVRVSRVISKIVNSFDDNGILTGKWDSDYIDGVSPIKWNGSVRILRQHADSKKAVKYGQCFVFSGVVTTICRALGIPCRSVTNFCSAHDSDGSITIDTYWDLETKENVEGMGKSDSVWNFHCWNDVWMRRNDLPMGNNGWQVIDSTPQERSDGMYQCGPMSLASIKSGNCEMLYDGPFVFAEVNADKVHWARDGGHWFVLSLDKSSIGKNISTKVADGMAVKPHLTDTSAIRQDITDEYKYRDESDRERLAVISANRSALLKRPVYNTGYQDVIFGGFELREFVLIGKDFKVFLTFRNVGDYLRTIKGKIICETVSYIGVKQDIVKEHSFTTQLSPRSDGGASMEVALTDYLSKISEQMAMKVSAVIQVVETGHVQAFQDDFRLRKPDLEVKVTDNDIRVGHPFKCRLSFVNPLPARLCNCCLTVEGPGLDAEEQFDLSNIGAHQEWAAILQLTPRKPGRRQISVSLDTHKIHDISGVEEIKVRP